jgi:hypothetical protein
MTLSRRRSGKRPPSEEDWTGLPDPVAARARVPDSLGRNVRTNMDKSGQINVGQIWTNQCWTSTKLDSERRQANPDGLLQSTDFELAESLDGEKQDAGLCTANAAASAAASSKAMYILA